MRNIFLFIRRYITFLLFLALQIVALWMLFNYNRFHRAVGMGMASQVTGTLNTQVDRLDDYFNQGEENKRVHRMNDSLLNLLNSNFSIPDTNRTLVTDSVLIDSTKRARRYYWYDAKVVYNSVNFDKNYIQINRGARYGIKDDMAVLSSDGAVVGVVVNTSANFSQVMSLLHIQNVVIGSLKKSGESGRVRWDGKDPRFIVLEGIPRDVPVKVGDTVLTSKYTFNFPPDRMIGTIASINNDPATGFYLLRLRPAVNFANIQQVFVVENLQREEQINLREDTEKKLDQKEGGGR